MLRILVKFYLGFSKQLYYFTSSQPWSEIAYCIILLPTWDILLKMNSWIIYTFKSLFAIAMLWLGGINHFHTRTSPPHQNTHITHFLFTGQNSRTVERDLYLQSCISDLAWVPLDDSGKVRWPLTKPHKDGSPQENRQRWARRDLFCSAGPVFSCHGPLQLRDLSQSCLTRHHRHRPARFLHLSHRGFPSFLVVFLRAHWCCTRSFSSSTSALTIRNHSHVSAGEPSHTSFACAHEESLLFILFFGCCNWCDEKHMSSWKMGALLEMSASSTHWSVWDTRPDEQTHTCMEIQHALCPESGRRLMAAWGPVTTELWTQDHPATELLHPGLSLAELLSHFKTVAVQTWTRSAGERLT